MKYQTGGIPEKSNHRTEERNSWAGDRIAITGIYSIGGEKSNSLCGESSSQFWIDEWGYPPIGVYFADCPSVPVRLQASTPKAFHNAGPCVTPAA